MEGEGRSRDVQAGLKIADRQPLGPGFDQETQYLEPGTVAQFGEDLGRGIELHVVLSTPYAGTTQLYFRFHGYNLRRSTMNRLASAPPLPSGGMRAVAAVNN